VACRVDGHHKASGNNEQECQASVAGMLVMKQLSGMPVVLELE
jgi:hypothetical protein